MSIARKVFRGGLGLGIIRIVSYGLQFVLQVLFARMLTPEVFGIVALGSSLLLTFSLFGRWGIVEAVVSNPDREALFSTIFWLRVGYAVLVLLLLGPLAFLLLYLYDPIVVKVFIVLSISQLVSMVGGIFRAALQEAITLVPIGGVDLAATVLAGAASILLILDGWKIWGYASFYVIRQLTQGIGFAILTPRYPRPTFRMETARWFARHAVGMFSSEALASVQSRGDDALIGTMGGTAILGVYSVAWRLVYTFKTATQTTINTAMKPLFGSLDHDDERSRRSLTFLLRLQLIITTPVFVGLALVAPSFVPFIFGEQWSSAAPVVRVLSIAGVLFPIEATCRHFYYSRGDSATVFSVQLRYIPTLLIGILILVPLLGEIGAAIAVNTMLVVSIALFGRHLKRDLDLGLLRLITPVTIAGAAGVGAGHFVRISTILSGIPELLQAGLVGSIGAISFLTAITILQWKTIRSDCRTAYRLISEPE